MRSFSFYPKLALTNIGKNRAVYRPYLLAGALIVSLYYILSSVAVMVQESGMEGGAHMTFILEASSTVCGLLSLVVLFYLNSFVMKRRKKEFGLFAVLGMEKRHLSLMMLWEVLFTGGFSILAGILGGALFSQLMFLLLLHITGLPISLTLMVPFRSVWVTILLYSVGFAVVFAYDLVTVARSNPIQLMQSSKEGEREPRTRWAAALMGTIALLGGYAIAWWVSNPSSALLYFFPAVLLVIIGTYFLFVAGSIVLLKALRNNKAFYYKPENFISVSGMLYRMKQNAAGLSNICILSTCVLVTLSSTVCLFIGEEDILKQRFPRHSQVNCILYDGEEPENIPMTVAEHAAQYGLTVTRPIGYADFTYPGLPTKTGFDRVKQYSSETQRITCIPVADYNAVVGENHSLAPGEVLLALNGESPFAVGETMTLAGQPYRVAGIVPALDFLGDMSSISQVGAILPDLEDLRTISLVPAREQTAEEQSGVDQGYLSYSDESAVVWYNYWYDLEGDPAQMEASYGTLREALLKKIDRLSVVDNIDLARLDFLSLYGSLLFVGLFFIALFLIATVLILYYKQVTEGFDDHDRFRIMQQVGMSDEEVRRTIRQQVRLVFFLPLGGAVIHIAVAFRVLCLLLQAFGMVNVPLFLGCTVFSVLAFTVFYQLVYRLTAKTYYRLVQAD